MNIHLIIELPLGDSEPYVTPYSSAELALSDGAAEYANALESREIVGDEAEKALAAFTHDLDRNAVYYCPHSESVYYRMERDLIKPQRKAPVEKPRWHVLTHMAGGAENCWTEYVGDKEVPTVFNTRKEAADYLTEHLRECRQSVKDGDTTDAPRRSDFTIERVTP